MCLSSLAFLIYLLYFYFQAPKVVKKGIAKKIAAVPAAMKKRVEKEKTEVNPLFERRPKNFGIGKCA